MCSWCLGAAWSEAFSALDVEGWLCICIKKILHCADVDIRRHRRLLLPCRVRGSYTRNGCKELLGMLSYTHTNTHPSSNVAGHLAPSWSPSPLQLHCSDSQ